MGEHKTSLEKHIFKASAFVLIAHVLFKLAGLIQAKAMVAFLPIATYDAVYAFAFENGIYMLFLIGEESLGPSFLPVFMRQLDTGSEKDAWSFANTILTVQFAVLAGVAAVLFCAPQAMVELMSVWGANSSPEKYELAVRSVRAMAPALIGLSLGSTTYVLLNGYKRFFLAAFGDAVWKFCAVLLLAMGVLFHADGAQWLMWGLVAGAACKVLTHLCGLRDKLRLFRPALSFSHPAVRRMAWLMLPLLAGIIFAKIRDVYNNVYVLSALDESGLMQANSIGKKLQSTLLFLVPYTLSIAVFPYFCELVDQKDHERLGRLVTRFGRMLLSVFVPFALFVAMAAVPLTALLFKGGYFDADAVRRTAVSLSFYTFMLPAAAIEMLVMQAFFANRRMVSVTVIGVLFSAFSMGVSWLGLKLCGSHDLLLLAVIAGGVTLARMLKCVTLVEMLKKNAPVFPFKEMAVFLARVTLASVAASVAGWLLLRFLTGLPGLSGRMGDVVKLGCSASVFGCVYLGCAYALRIVEVHELYALALQKVRKRA